MNQLESAEAYEAFVYTLHEKYSQIKISTLVFKRMGALIGELTGALTFENEIRLVVRERIDFRLHVIKVYSYEVWHGKGKLYWYDSQPHPADPQLASTHPHHKHIPPDIKHNRVPAPGMSFESPNLHFLTQEIIDTLL